MITILLIRSSIATLIAWLGGLTGAWISEGARRHLPILVNGSLGALFAVTLFDILPDAKALLNIPIFTIATLSGLLVFWAIGKYVYPICPACSTDDGSHSHLDIGRTAILLTITLGLHSFMDGAAVVVSDKISGATNYAVFIAVSLHKLPEGLALVLLLIGAGMVRRRALLWTVAIESATELGAVTAVLVVSHMSTFWLGVLFANIGGGFLYLVVNAFISQVVENRATGEKRLQYVAYVSGAFGFLVAAVTMAVGEAVVR